MVFWGHFHIEDRVLVKDLGHVPLDDRTIFDKLAKRNKIRLEEAQLVSLYKVNFSLLPTYVKRRIYIRTKHTKKIYEIDKKDEKRLLAEFPAQPRNSINFLKALSVLWVTGLICLVFYVVFSQWL